MLPRVCRWGNVQGTCCTNLLKQALVPYVDTDTCNRPDYYGSQITENMLCAGYAQGGTDTCQVMLEITI